MYLCDPADAPADAKRTPAPAPVPPQKPAAGC